MLIIVGGGGLTNVDVDVINEFFEKQVEKYVEAAEG